MNGHTAQWQSPQPLWARFGSSRPAAATADDQARPAILRFASDDFMEQILGTLARDPAQIGRLLARPETWRQPIQDAPDLIERVPVPRLAQDAIRRESAKAPKTRITAVASKQVVKEQAVTREVPLKLYQPAHQRYYLVGASLVCALPGLPERAVEPGGAEQLNFVLRRMLPLTTNGTGPRQEFAYVKEAAGSRWQLLGDAENQLAPGEELLPLFPLGFDDDAQHRRTLWAGMLPVGRREEYLSGAVEYAPLPKLAAGQRQSVLPPAAPAAKAGKQARLMHFKMDVAEPWKNLIRSSWKTWAAVNEASRMEDSEPPEDKIGRVYNFNLQQQLASWLALLDFADYLETYLKDVWDVVRSDGANASSLQGERSTLYQWLASSQMSAALTNGLPAGPRGRKPVAPSLANALKRIVLWRDALERIETLYDGTAPTLTEPDEWPDFHYLLAGIEYTQTFTGPVFAPSDPFSSPPGPAPDPDEVASDQGPGLTNVLRDTEVAAAKVDILTAKVYRALEDRVESDAPPPPFAAQVAEALRKTAGDEGWFLVRFVYTRRDCGPLHPPTLSAPTQQFQLASFFDPDAPARPIRISLPLDTTPAGLRKHKKNTAFVISDLLCGQMQRAKGLGFIDLVLAVLPWPFHKDLPTGSTGPCKSQSFDLGMICTLSIPIITICALILLAIIVGLLDLIFRWLPWFIACFPVPKFKGKQP